MDIGGTKARAPRHSQDELGGRHVEPVDVVDPVGPAQRQLRLVARESIAFCAVGWSSSGRFPPAVAHLLLVSALAAIA